MQKKTRIIKKKMKIKSAKHKLSTIKIMKIWDEYVFIQLQPLQIH